MTRQPTPVKVIKRDDRRTDRDQYIERHEKSLIELLRDESPERAREFLQRLSKSLKLV